MPSVSTYVNVRFRLRVQLIDATTFSHSLFNKNGDPQTEGRRIDVACI